jgi:hypothetical protein
MPTVLYSPDFGAGFKIPTEIKRRYLHRRGIHVDKMEDIYDRFHLAVYDTPARTIGGWIVGGSENARAIPEIVEMYMGTRDEPVWRGARHLTFSDVFADYWYVSHYDGRETLHINIDGPFYRLSEAYFQGLIDDRTFCDRYREAAAARQDLINSVEMGEIADANIDIHYNRLQATDHQPAYSKDKIVEKLEERLLQELLETEDFEEVASAAAGAAEPPS